MKNSNQILSENRNNKVRHILWTGGWDSTFAVVDALVRGDVVQPYYVTDPHRQSRPYELAAIDAITRNLDKVLGAGTRDRLRGMIFFALADISPDPSVALKLEQIRETTPLGSQYDWLMPLAHHMKDRTLELSIEGRSADVTSTAYLLRKDLTQEGYGGRLKPQISRPEFSVYRPVYFPVIHLTKRDMQRIASDEGWLRLMKKTHFCHRPRKSSAPCGKCNPCRIAWQQGMGFRFPLKMRVKLAAKDFLQRRAH
ncbi:7-cyano-7-deazaguanine synthase [Shimia ponticola]|uniref:7-cyano-7-deazaguanine synthase n=1 Tax=Shimia ponticola TaxID=2582893 RepID=UPI0011BFB4ED|nr:7-cyano-7-deazaguanine synthase [Shimia ponticola]